MAVGYILAVILCVIQVDDVAGGWGFIHPDKANARSTALLLASYKYFDVDKRKGNDVMWKYEERVFFKHFPVPRLRRLHPQVARMCEKNVYSCMKYLATINVDSFKTHLELFQLRTTAAYFMCWYTMKRDEGLSNFMDGKNCLDSVDTVKEVQSADYKVQDYRFDSPNDPFLCATILFCPDPCYGHKTSGSVASSLDMWNDAGNPCRQFKDRSCKWVFNKNEDFVSLQKNKFNISCKCDQKGFEWNSQFEMCVDIDECENIRTKCDKGRQCVNTEGGFECLCPRGQRFDTSKDKCVEHTPLPKHSYARSGKVKAHRQRSAFMRMVEYILGLRKDTGA